MKTLELRQLDARGGGALTWLRFGLVSILLFGLAFPALLTLAGRGLFPDQATGSLARRDGVVVGSRLVAQPFLAERYFSPRPSAAGYDPKVLAGSNLGPSNPALAERIAATSAALAVREGVAAKDIPVDLVTASGSGIDPHISPAAAALQVARVARARGLPAAEVELLVGEHTEGRWLGIFGQDRVNVLELNLALDAGKR